jgi:hypothetical protein
MRLIRYLSEITRTKPEPQLSSDKRDDVEKWMAIIEPQCGQIIKEYRKADGFFYRGSTGPSFVEKAGRDKKVRPPKDTPVEVHRHLNKLFLKKFGWKVRDGVSVTADRNTAETYGGTTFLFFPVDGYAYAWSRKVADLYNWLPLELKRVSLSRQKTKVLKQAEILKFEETLSELVSLYSRSGIQHALRHDSEVMFRTKKWFGIEERYETHVAEHLEIWD